MVVERFQKKSVTRVESGTTELNEQNTQTRPRARTPMYDSLFRMTCNNISISREAIIRVPLIGSNIFGTRLVCSHKASGRARFIASTRSPARRPYGLWTVAV